MGHTADTCLLSRRNPWPWFVLVVLLSAVGARALMIQPSRHPNHYVLLVDASGSVAQPARAAVYRSALATAVRRMYQDGFGVLPPFDPERDVLTIEHFGCVAAGTADSAYRRLHDVDFLRDVIHPVIRREPHVSADRALQFAFPNTRYHLTLLIWSVPLGIAAIAPQAPDQVAANRTFLIRVTDMIVNDATAREEQALIENNGRKDRVDAARAAMSDLAAKYVIGDAAGKDAPLLTETFGRRADQSDSVTMHIWEIRSRALDAWAANAAQVKKLATAEIAWGSREGHSVPGVMTVQPTAEMQSAVLANATFASVQRPVPGAPRVPWSSQQPAAVTVSIVECVATPVPLTITALTRFVDPLLGSVEYTVTSTEVLPLPIPPVCGLPFRILLSVLVAFGILTVAGTTYVLLFTRRWTRIDIRRPAGLKTWRLRWDMPINVDDVLLPDETEALRVDLPTGMHRWLLYRNAQLVLQSKPPGEFQWADTDREIISVSDAGPWIHVRRRDGKRHAAALRVEVQRKSRAAVFERAPQREEERT
jgi:hypothetical protein